MDEKKIGLIILIAVVVVGAVAAYLYVSQPVVRNVVFSTGFESAGAFNSHVINVGRVSTFSSDKFKNDVPSGWAVNVNSTGVFHWTNTTAHFGSKSLRLSGPSSSIVATHKISLRPEQSRNLTVGAWVKTNGLQSSYAFVDVLTVTSDNKFVVIGRSAKLIGTADWYGVNIPFNAPKNADNIVVQLVVLSKNTYPSIYDRLPVAANYTAKINERLPRETVWFDDVIVIVRGK